MFPHFVVQVSSVFRKIFFLYQKLNILKSKLMYDYAVMDNVCDADDSYVYVFLKHMLHERIISYSVECLLIKLNIKVE